MKAALISIILFPVQAFAISAPQVEGSETKADLYAQIAERLSRDSPVFGAPDIIKKWEDPEDFFDMGKVFWLRGRALIKVDADSGKLRSVSNLPLMRAIRDKEITQSVPELSYEAALFKAKSYLKEYGITLDGDTLMQNICFNYGASSACWEVRWQRCWNGYVLDDFAGMPETVYVIFHEKLGLEGIGTTLSSPKPQSFEVTLSREAAITKAATLTDDVMRTPYYKMARLPGFKATALVSCELKVFKPNWLLDPKRAIWIAEHPATETRLCWVVKFSTIDTLEDTRPKAEDGTLLKFKRPDIVIYLDAATGECVGANFS